VSCGLHTGATARLFSAALASLLVACGAPPTTAPAGLGNWLGPTDASGYATATPGTALTFPEDHGAHPDFRIEWWYYTFRLSDPAGRDYGAQLALFRLATRPQAAATEGWDSAQVFMAHLAVSELDAGRFHFSERLARPVLGLAGAASAPHRVWVENCRVEERPTEPGQAMSRRIDCRQEGLELALDLASAQPPVLHGKQGYSRKASHGESASFYYSFPRIAVHGHLTVPDSAAVAVQGQGWFDHEWSSGLLPTSTVGWDWLSLTLDNGEALMLFRLRDAGGDSREVRGSLIAADGGLRSFVAPASAMQGSRPWRSPHSSARYPLAWKIELDDFDLRLQVDAELDDQELNTSVRYWEGAVRASGSHKGVPVKAQGYLEMTGYAP